MNLKVSYYKNALLSIRRGNSRGVFINAKPLFIVALIDAIENGVLFANHIMVTDNLFRTTYVKVCETLEPLRDVTDFHHPYFHLNAEPFYTLKYKVGVEPHSQAHTPSVAYIRDNIEYAYLDEGLWELLQDAEVRTAYKQAIIKYYIKTQE